MNLDTFYVGDAIDIMADMPANFIDLTVTSPPYDKMREYEGCILTFEDFKIMAHQLYRVTKNGGVVVWIVGDQTKDGTESLTSFKQAVYFKEEVGFKMHDTMIYEKSGFSQPSNNRYHQVFEYMFILVKGKLKTFNPIKDRENIYAGQPAQWGKNMQRQPDGTMLERKKREPTKKFGMRFNIWRFSVGKNLSTSDQVAFKCPAIFPEKLAQDHILSWSNPGDLVLDPMCGSGTTCKMAHLLNRNWIGIDKVGTYINHAKERMELHGWRE